MNFNDPFNICTRNLNLIFSYFLFIKTLSKFSNISRNEIMEIDNINNEQVFAQDYTKRLKEGNIVSYCFQGKLLIV